MNCRTLWVLCSLAGAPLRHVAGAESRISNRRWFTVSGDAGKMQATRDAACTEDFYHGSQLEARFTAEPERLTSTPGVLCSTLGSATDAWVHRNRARVSPPSDDAIFSTICRSGSPQQVIEPLAGILRSPQYPCRMAGASGGSQGDPMMNVDWLVLADNRSFPEGIKGKRIFFDAGGSRFADAMRFFAPAYEARGIPFDEIYVWEAMHLPDETYWQGTPEAVRKRWEPHVKFYSGIPVTDEVDSENNPIARIHQHCGPDDFCAFKLDIDTPALEWSLVQQLRADPGHLKEFFFEHHVHGLMEKIWKDVNGTISDSYDLFEDLRRQGVRAHSWV
ncbi:hypothetical protein AK812_SmicGene12229 [Symbiodinium microadriaticum]|uniref:Uncharacterized protein n=1 Tax=Symbiodinium microadriaticum TaxID=2951 RepID=A0A1Q9EB76_SYMMI|nr:hypothetical protein AK812_SmicGene12229 [Symbiodinium microadriaticum]CAE7900137.1 unnamed protein product [Symbiodinium sp. KB8]